MVDFNNPNNSFHSNLDYFEGLSFNIDETSIEYDQGVEEPIAFRVEILRSNIFLSPFDQVPTEKREEIISEKKVVLLKGKTLTFHEKFKEVAKEAFESGNVKIKYKDSKGEQKLMNWDLKNVRLVTLSDFDYYARIDAIFKNSRSENEKDKIRIDETVKDDNSWYKDSSNRDRIKVGLPEKEQKKELEKLTHLKIPQSEAAVMEKANEKRRIVLERAEKIEGFFREMKNNQIARNREKDSVTEDLINEESIEQKIEIP